MIGDKFNRLGEELELCAFFFGQLPVVGAAGHLFLRAAVKAGDLFRFHPHRGAQAVGGCVSTTDDGNLFPGDGLWVQVFGEQVGADIVAD